MNPKALNPKALKTEARRPRRAEAGTPLAPSLVVEKRAVLGLWLFVGGFRASSLG